MAHLYADENFPREVVIALRLFGHDVVTALEAGNANQAISDAGVLTFATQQHRAVLTINRRDFFRLHARHPHHAGIIACTQDEDTSGQAERIHQAIMSAESLHGQLIRVNRPAR